MKKIVKGLISVLIIIDVVIFFLLFATYFNWMNPPDKSNEQYMQLDYPPTEHGVKIYFSDNWTLRGLLCTVDLYLNYTGTLAEEVSIDVYAMGCKYADGEGIDHVSIRFSGASDYVESGQVIRTGSPLFNPMLINQSLLRSYSDTTTGVGSEETGFIPQSEYGILRKPPSVLGTIVYNVHGSYYPSLTLWFNNGSSVSAEYPYYNHRIYVVGSDVVLQEKETIKGNTMTFYGIILGVLNIPALGAFIFKQFIHKNKTSNGDQSQSQRSKKWHQRTFKKKRKKKH